MDSIIAAPMIKKIPVSQAYFYTITRMAIDAGGAPNSYHPLDKGIDALANAGFPEGNWKAILVENPTKSDEPFVQTGGEFAVFFVSRTTLQDRSLAVTDVRRYVDSMRVPYIVFPGEFFKLKGSGDFGDVGLAINFDNGNESPFIIADAGPQKAPLGEVSIRLAENLGGTNVSPRPAQACQGELYLPGVSTLEIKPGVASKSQQLQKHTQELLAAMGVGINYAIALLR